MFLARLKQTYVEQWTDMRRVSGREEEPILFSNSDLNGADRDRCSSVVMRWEYKDCRGLCGLTQIEYLKDTTL